MIPRAARGLPIQEYPSPRRLVNLTLGAMVALGFGVALVMKLQGGRATAEILRLHILGSYGWNSHPTAILSIVTLVDALVVVGAIFAAKRPEARTFLLVSGGAFGLHHIGLWIRGQGSDCGCFGPHATGIGFLSPLLAGLACALGVVTRPPSDRTVGFVTGRRSVVVLAAITALLTSTYLVTSLSSGPRAATVAEVLRDRDCFLFLFSPACEHCLEVASRLRPPSPESPRLLLVTADELGPVDSFQAMLPAGLEVRSLPLALWYSLLRSPPPGYAHLDSAGQVQLLSALPSSLLR